MNWNGASDTKECLNSLITQTYTNYEIILVENGSTDSDTEDLLKFIDANHGDVEVIKNDENLGFAGGVNSGIKHAIKNGFDFVALFNNDAIAEPRWLEELVEAQEKHKSGITTGLLLHEDGKTIDSTGDWYTVWGLPFPRGRNQPTESADESDYVFSGSGGGSLYSIDMLKEIGLFDESFFAYYEDTDISFRAQLYGYKVYYTDKAVAYHKQGASSSKISGFTTTQTFKNLPLLFVKNVPSYLLFRIGTRFYFAYFLIFLNAVKNGNGIPALKGFLQHLKIFWTKSIKDRKAIQSSKKVDRKYLESILINDLPPDQTGLRKFRSFFTKQG